MNKNVAEKYANEIHTYPNDVQRIFTYMLQHPEIEAYNGLYRASHARLYNVTLLVNVDDIFIQYFSYEFPTNRYGFSIPLTLPVTKTYLMFVMDAFPVQESHFIDNQWHLIKG